MQELMHAELLLVNGWLIVMVLKNLKFIFWLIASQPFVFCIMNLLN